MAGEEYVQPVYYRDARGIEPVYEFCRAQQPAARAKLDNQIERLRMQRVNGPPLPFPLTSQVDGELRELRCQLGKTKYRVLYRRFGRLVVLLHIVEKHAERLDEGAIRVAQARWVDAMSRAEALGREAPWRVDL